MATQQGVTGKSLTGLIILSGFNALKVSFPLKGLCIHTDGCKKVMNRLVHYVHKRQKWQHRHVNEG